MLGRVLSISFSFWPDKGSYTGYLNESSPFSINRTIINLDFISWVFQIKLRGTLNFEHRDGNALQSQIVERL